MQNQQTIQSRPVNQRLFVVLASLLSLFAVSFAQTVYAGSRWTVIDEQRLPKFLSCSSDVGTDGDLLFEVPVTLKLTTERFDPSEAHANEISSRTLRFGKILIDSQLSYALFADLSDVSPLGTEVLEIRKGEAEIYDLLLPQVPFRLAIASELKLGTDPSSDQFELLAAVIYRDGLGLARCQLVDRSYNSQDFDGLDH